MKYAIPPRVEARGISNSNGSGGANRCRQNHAPKAPAAVYYGRLQIRHAVSAASGHTHPTQLYIAPTGTVIRSTVYAAISRVHPTQLSVFRVHTNANRKDLGAPKSSRDLDTGLMEQFAFVWYLNSSVPTVVEGSSGVKRKWLRGLTTVTSYRSLFTSRAVHTDTSHSSSSQAHETLTMDDGACIVPYDRMRSKRAVRALSYAPWLWRKSTPNTFASWGRVVLTESCRQHFDTSRG